MKEQYEKPVLQSEQLFEGAYSALNANAEKGYESCGCCDPTRDGR
jgi:hypothetical protein